MSLPAGGAAASYRDRVCSSGESPIFYDMIASLGADKAAAERLVAELRALLSDLEALHEPNVGGDCPTCRAPAPCLTLRMLHGDIGLEDAFATLRDDQPIDLVAAETSRPTRPVPSLKELLAVAPTGVDRFFQALLADPPAKPRREETA